jgi:dolichyl-phosphate beta-glucosyltransferase
MVSYSNYEYWKTTPLEGEPYLSVVVPISTADDDIVAAICAIALHVSGLGFPWEMLVVDDGTQEQVLDAIDDLNFANLRIVESTNRSGKGSIVQSGMLAASGRYVLLTDTNTPPPVEDIERLLHKLQYEGYDLAIAAPMSTEHETEHRSWMGRVVHNGVHHLLQELFYITIQNIQSGFTIFRRKVARHLHMLQTMKDFSFNLEILYLAAKLGYKVAEVPVHRCCPQSMQQRINQRALRLLFDLITIKQNDQNGVYDLSLPWSDYLSDAEERSLPSLKPVKQRLSLPS